MKKTNLSLVTGGLLLLLFLCMLFAFQVRTTEVAVVTTFGRFSRSILEPGIYGRLPLPIQTVYKFDRRLQSFERKFEATLTRDQKNILSEVFIGWRVEDPRIYLERYNADPAKAEAALENVVRNAKNAVLGRHRFSELVTANTAELKFDAIEQEMLETVRQSMTNHFGIAVELLGIKQLGLPENITAEVFKRMKAERERLAAKYEGEGQGEAKKIRSEADVVREELLANARRIAAQAEGEAAARVSESLKILEKEPDLAKFLIELRVLENSLKERTTLVLDSKTPTLNLLRQSEAGASTPPKR